MGSYCHQTSRVKPRWDQPPDAENRTSGGVGGVTGANPVTSTRSFKHRSAMEHSAFQLNSYG